MNRFSASLLLSLLLAAAAPAFAEETVVVAKTEKTVTIKKDEKNTAAGSSDVLAVKDTDENYNLPAYPAGARVSVGKMDSYVTGEEDTFLDIARHFGLGYVELRAANPAVDPWSPTPGTELTIPGFNLLPRAKQEGIVVNLGKMRLYYFKNPGEPPLTYAIGIGREGLQTPTGETTIIRKVAGPQWFPTDRMKKEKPWLPSAVPAGPSNPLGTHAMYLGWPTFLIHGSNKPWGIGRRVSSGCMRMYPEDIVSVFDMVPVGTKVTVVDQPILVGWLNDGLYLEANPSQTQSSEVEYDNDMTVRPLTEGLRKVITDAAGVNASNIDWSAVEQTVKERRGYPVLIAQTKAGLKKTEKAKETVKDKTEKTYGSQSSRFN